MTVFPPKDLKEWNLTRAHKEVADAAKWADRMGYRNLAPRLQWAANLIKEELNKTARTDGERQQEADGK